MIVTSNRVLLVQAKKPDWVRSRKARTKKDFRVNHRQDYRPWQYQQKEV
jgi:hypothetical protein